MNPEDDKDGELHRLLQRQLRKATGDDGKLDLDPLIAAVNDVYKEFDILRRRQERAMTLVSEEMSSQNRELQEIRIKSERLAEGAHRANKAKSDFLASMSHELRTPLNSIIGMLKLVIEDGGISQEHREMLDVVEKSSVHLLNIVNEILDLSKIEAGRVELENIPVTLPNVIDHVQALLAPSAESKGLSFRTSYETGRDMPPVLADPTWLTRVYINLAGNAIKYTEEGGVTVLVSHKVRNEDGRVDFIVEIIDTGIGISSEQREKVFAKFSQADSTITRRFGGTGLGLAITQQLVGMMRGRVELESEAGMGSTFKVLLSFPIASPETVAQGTKLNKEAAARQAELVRKPISEVRVLAAEDNPMNQFYLKKLFQNLGIRDYDIVDGGQSAVDAVRENAAYDLVLMDCHMPEVSGYDAAESIRAYAAEAGLACPPIVALTADAMAGAREKCLRSGMDDYIMKPISHEEFMAVLRRWAVLDESATADNAAAGTA